MGKEAKKTLIGKRLKTSDKEVDHPYSTRRAGARRQG